MGMTSKKYPDDNYANGPTLEGVNASHPQGGPTPMVSEGYTGAPMFFEGGVRGGGVSEHETMPAQYVYPKKNGYDEHRGQGRSSNAARSVHGVAGAEGMPSGGSDGDDSPSTSDGMAGKKGPHSCMGCGFATVTPHGLARHMRAKHGYGKLGHALTHGDSYPPMKELPGESDDAPKMTYAGKKGEANLRPHPFNIKDTGNSY